MKISTQEIQATRHCSTFKVNQIRFCWYYMFGNLDTEAKELIKFIVFTKQYLGWQVSDS